jgi:ParB family chromosome partitioning protein
MAQKPALGKGLASLLSSTSKEAHFSGHKKNDSSQDSGKDRVLGISHLKLDQIQLNSHQPRKEFDPDSIKELCASIQVNGIIQPLVVRKKTDGKFELIAGERRLRAARLAGLAQVPVVFRVSTDRESLELALVENIQRENLNVVDEALAYQQLMQEFQLNREQVAERVGKHLSSVKNILRILVLPPTILQDLRDGAMGLGHAKAILSVDSVEDQLYVRNQICEKNLSVREAEDLSQQMKKKKKPLTSDSLGKESKKSSRLFHIAQDLTRHFGLKVQIKGTEERGRLVLYYHEKEDLNRILEGLKPL